jgi:uncharacterized integral membrane protein
MLRDRVGPGCRRAFANMNAKLIFKTIFLIIILLLLVIMGMNNTGAVTFKLPPILPRKVDLPAAYMYFAFFAVGVLSGTILTAGGGGGKKGASSSKARPEK